MSVSDYRKEQAAKQEKARYMTVLQSPEAKGRTDLALVLLSTDLMPQEIIVALGKAPTPSEAAPAPPTTNVDPTLAKFERPNVDHSWWDPNLYEAGRAFALWSQGSLAKKE